MAFERIVYFCAVENSSILEVVKMQKRQDINIIKYYFAKSKEKICAYLQVGKAEMMFQN